MRDPLLRIARGERAGQLRHMSMKPCDEDEDEADGDGDDDGDDGEDEDDEDEDED